MTKRESIPKAIQSKVLIQSRRRCCLCFGLNGDLSEKKGQITHLDRNPSNNDPGNLAWLCFDHHDQYDSTPSQGKGLTIDEVKRYRAELYQAVAGMREGAGTGGVSSLPPRPLYAIVGLFVGAAVDLLINLLAAAIQQRAFADQFGSQSIGWLAGLIVVGLLTGYWLSGPVRLPAPAPHRPAVSGSPQTVTITRLRALLSYAKLRGLGIHLSDILLIGSRIDIDTRD